MPGLEHLRDRRRRDDQVALAVAFSRPAMNTVAPPAEQARLAQPGDAQLRALQVGDQRERAAELSLHRAGERGAARVLVVGAVREVEADGVHPGRRRARAASPCDPEPGPIVATIFVRLTCLPSAQPNRAPRARGDASGRRRNRGTARRLPSSSSIRSRRLYLATRSERAGAPVLIWPAFGRDREVGDRRVLGLARAVRDHGRVARLLREPDRVERLGQRPDLVRP